MSTERENKIVGKWKYVSSSGGSLLFKFAQGLASMTGGQIKEFEFLPGNTVTGSSATGPSFTGTYIFLDDYHIRMDSPRISIVADLNETYDKMTVRDAGGLRITYQKIR